MFTIKAFLFLFWLGVSKKKYAMEIYFILTLALNLMYLKKTKNYIKKQRSYKIQYAHNAKFESIIKKYIFEII